MNGRRVLAIGLDGYEESVERQLIEAGELPAMARLRRQSARYLLDHGPAQRTGLAWEHVSTGMSPERAGRAAAVHFDPATYAVWQEGTRSQPFAARLSSRTVVFDTPYFDFNQAPQACGVVGWGAHDPGVPLGSQPAGLLPEFAARFGSYPATEWIYGYVWPSKERARRMGQELARGVETRSHAARWLLGERLPDWDLAMVVVSEPHSVIEGLWHGIDPSHRLHHLPSAAPARDGMLAVYRAVDRLVGDLADAFADAALIVFSMGGMGPNRSDVASMVLLPELMYRRAFGRPYLQQPTEWTDVSGAGPLLGENDSWSRAVNAHVPAAPAPHGPRRLLSRLVPGAVKRALRRGDDTSEAADKAARRRSIAWMPAARYRHHWHSMRAFALPSLYDGRLRVNLSGRERKGTVPISEYDALCDEIEAFLRECRDAATGEPVVDYIERDRDRDPLTFGPTDSDLVVVWKAAVCAIDHPTLGRVGPVPFRRPGGHTGPFGMAYLQNAGIGAGDRGLRRSFDVVPTLIELLGETVPAGLSGTSLLSPSASDGLRSVPPLASRAEPVAKLHL